MDPSSIETRRRWPAAAAIVLVLLVGSCNKNEPQASTPSRTGSPYRTSTPTQVPSPGGPHGDATTVLPNVFFVVGDKGINGTSIIPAGIKVISITNNDDMTHQLDVVRISKDTTVEEISKAAGSGSPDWMTKAGHVFVRGPVQPGQVTKQVKVAGIKPGAYALVDVETGPHGDPYAARTAFVLVVQVMETP